MINASQVLGQGSVAGGEGLFVRDPRLLPWLRAISTQVYVRQGSYLRSAGTESQFWTALAARGAVASNITSAGQWYTLCNLAGSGLLSGILTPAIGHNRYISVRMTVDGAVYTATQKPIGAQAGRIFIGAALVRNVPVSGSSMLTSHLDWNDSATFTIDDEGGVVAGRVGTIYPLSVDAAISLRMPVLRFDSQLKVEVQYPFSTDIYNSETFFQYSGALYQLDRLTKA